MTFRSCNCIFTEECYYSGPLECREVLRFQRGEAMMRSITDEIRREDSLQRERKMKEAKQKEAVHHA